MLTPLEIENRSFKKSIYGYKIEEIEEFLDKINEDYEYLYKENIELKDKISMLNEGIQHYKVIEQTLQNTLLVAQTTAEDIKKNAYEKSENIQKDAEIKAQKIIDDTNKNVIKIKCQYEDLRQEYEVFKTKVKALLTSQLELFMNDGSIISKSHINEVNIYNDNDDEGQA